MIIAGVGIMALALAWVLTHPQGLSPNTTGRTVDTLFFDVITGENKSGIITLNVILDSLRCLSLPQVISVLYPEYIVITGDELRKGLARNGKSLDLEGRSLKLDSKIVECIGIIDVYPRVYWDRNLRQHGVHAYLMVIAELRSLREDAVSMKARFVRLTDSGYKATEGFLSAKMSNAPDTIVNLLKRCIETLRKSENIGVISSVTKEEIVFRLQPGRAMQKGMQLEILRLYVEDDRGRQQESADIEQENPTSS